MSVVFARNIMEIKELTNEVLTTFKSVFQNRNPIKLGRLLTPAISEPDRDGDGAICIQKIFNVVYCVVLQYPSFLTSYPIDYQRVHKPSTSKPFLWEAIQNQRKENLWLAQQILLLSVTDFVLLVLRVTFLLAKRKGNRHGDQGIYKNIHSSVLGYIY